jgi:hypothetical protein
MRSAIRMGNVAACPNEGVITLLVKVENLKKLIAKRGYSLCPLCVQRYERKPAAAVWLLFGPSSIAHIAPAIYTRRPPHDLLLRRRPARLYDGQNIKGLYERIYCAAHNMLCDPIFVRHLLLRYPALQDKTMTEKALREAGCDLEAEIALFKLAGWRS